MILLLGASGYVGQAFAAELRKRGTPFIPLTRATVDYSRLDALFNYVRSTKPALIINAAGFTGGPSVDACEVLRAETVQANTLVPQTIARVCYLTKTPWAHISSGCIYSGAKVRHPDGLRIERDLNRPEIRRLFEQSPELFAGFSETDIPNFSFHAPPCSFYSGTKALAEESLIWHEQTYFWRPRILFDEIDHPRNLLSKLQAFPKIRDAINSLTHRGEFARACLDLWDQRAPFGIYNVVNPGAISGRQIAELIQRVRKPERAPEFWKDDEEFYRFAARAPRSNCILDGARLASAGIRLRPVREAITDSLERWQSAGDTQLWRKDVTQITAVK